MEGVDAYFGYPMKGGDFWIGTDPLALAATFPKQGPSTKMPTPTGPSKRPWRWSTFDGRWFRVFAFAT